MATTQPPHIVFVPSPGMGHLIPLVQLANKIIHSYPHFTISFLIPTMGPPSQAQRAAVEALSEPAHADSAFLEPVSLDDLPPDTKPETRIVLTLARSLPGLRAHLRPMVGARRLTALIVDPFGTDAFDVCPEFGLRPYVFFPCSAMSTSFYLLLPELDSQVKGEFRDMDEPVRIPGCVPVHGRDLIDPVQDRKDDAYKWLIHNAKKCRLAEGILVNSFEELEGEAIRALQQPGPNYKPPVYSIGPLVKSGSGEGVDGSECLKWLDEQPRDSVLFVSFGSGGTLSNDQTIELAYGLEMSEVRFLWVVKSPNDKVANATFFGSQVEKDPLGFLPEGYLDRIKGRGLVIPSWAPQIKVLSHGSTGGFLTHCGWNSILESVVHAVPLIAWPLYAEQKMNAIMLTDSLEVAIRPRDYENGLIGREEISRIIKRLMKGEEGKKISNKMRELKDAATKVLSENGSSTKALSKVALSWESL